MSDSEPLVKLVGHLVETFVTMKNVDPGSEVVEKVLQLMLCVIVGLCSSKDTPALLRVSVQWESVFDLRSQRYCFIF